MRILGIVLIIIGIIALAYQGITYTKKEKVLDVGPIEASVNTQKRIPLPPIVGGVALVAGFVLLLVRPKRA